MSKAHESAKEKLTEEEYDAVANYWFASGQQDGMKSAANWLLARAGQLFGSEIDRDQEASITRECGKELLKQAAEAAKGKA